MEILASIVELTTLYIHCERQCNRNNRGQLYSQAVSVWLPILLCRPFSPLGAIGTETPRRGSSYGRAWCQDPFQQASARVSTWVRSSRMHGLNLSLSEFSSDGADDKGELGLRKDALHPVGWNWTYVTVPVTCHIIKGAMENPIWQNLGVTSCKIVIRENLNKLEF